MLLPIFHSSHLNWQFYSFEIAHIGCICQTLEGHLWLYFTRTSEFQKLCYGLTLKNEENIFVLCFTRTNIPCLRRLMQLKVSNQIHTISAQIEHQRSIKFWVFCWLTVVIFMIFFVQNCSFFVQIMSEIDHIVPKMYLMAF